MRKQGFKEQKESLSFLKSGGVDVVKCVYSRSDEVHKDPCRESRQSSMLFILKRSQRPTFGRYIRIPAAVSSSSQLCCSSCSDFANRRAYWLLHPHGTRC